MRRVACQVCETVLEPATVERSTFRRRVYTFCSAECRAAFERNPRAFVPRTGGGGTHPAGRERSRGRSVALFAVLLALVALLPVVLALGLWSLGIGTSVSAHGWLIGLGLLSTGLLVVLVVEISRRLRPPA